MYVCAWVLQGGKGQEKNTQQTCLTLHNETMWSHKNERAFQGAASLSILSVHNFLCYVLSAALKSHPVFISTHLLRLRYTLPVLSSPLYLLHLVSPPLLHHHHDSYITSLAAAATTLKLAVFRLFFYHRQLLRYCHEWRNLLQRSMS